MAIEFAYIYFVYHLSSYAKIANNRCKWILRSECMLYRKPYRKKNVNSSRAKFYNNVCITTIIDIILLLMEINESMILHDIYWTYHLLTRYGQNGLLMY